MKIIAVKNYEEMSSTACNLLIEKINQVDYPVLGLATGSTPEGLYQLLIEKFNNNEVSFKNVKSFNLDEYVGLKKDNPNSYYYYMNNNFFHLIDIPDRNINIPNGLAKNLQKECEEYEEKIKQANNIDVQILGIGLNGHIGFNEPGTSFASVTQVVDLNNTTIESNSRFFKSIDEVPRQAISMGISTIMQSKEAILLVTGKNKAEILSKFIKEEPTEDLPASILKNHENLTIIADEDALSKFNND